VIPIKEKVGHVRPHRHFFRLIALATNQHAETQLNVMEQNSMHQSEPINSPSSSYDEHMLERALVVNKNTVHLFNSRRKFCGGTRTVGLVLLDIAQTWLVFILLRFDTLLYSHIIITSTY
jgi:hypothetical protein